MRNWQWKRPGDERVVERPPEDRLVLRDHVADGFLRSPGRLEPVIAEQPVVLRRAPGLVRDQVEIPEARLPGPHGEVEPGLLDAQRLLGLLALGDVPDDGPHGRRQAVLAEEERPELDREDRPVLAPVLLLVDVGVAAREDLLGHDPRLRGVPGLRRELRVGQLAQLVGAVTEHRPEGLVRLDDGPGHVHHDHAVHHGVEEPPVLRLGDRKRLLGPPALSQLLLEASLLGDVGQHHAHRPAIRLLRPGAGRPGGRRRPTRLLAGLAGPGFANRCSGRPRGGSGARWRSLRPRMERSACRPGSCGPR